MLFLSVLLFQLVSLLLAGLFPFLAVIFPLLDFSAVFFPVLAPLECLRTPASLKVCHSLSSFHRRKWRRRGVGARDHGLDAVVGFCWGCSCCRQRRRQFPFLGTVFSVLVLLCLGPLHRLHLGAFRGGIKEFVDGGWRQVFFWCLGSWFKAFLLKLTNKIVKIWNN